MNKILIATTNPGKLAEIKHYLADLPLVCYSLSDLGITESVAETGITFKKNAVIKAKYYSKISGLPTITDDGGLEIDALQGEPGVKSHRWINSEREATDEELISYTLTKMNKIPLNNRGAQFRTVVAFITLNGKIFTKEALVRGIITEKPSTHPMPGFPYRSLFYLPEINKFYDHSLLTESQMEQYNHRGKAIKKLIPEIRKAFGV